MFLLQLNGRGEDRLTIIGYTMADRQSCNIIIDALKSPQKMQLPVIPTFNGGHREYFFTLGAFTPSKILLWKTSSN
jgi:hypothetical protein